jgi:hypothetical protein
VFVARIVTFVLLMFCVCNWDCYSFDAIAEQKFCSDVNDLRFVTSLSVGIARFVTLRVSLLALLCF